MLLNKITAKLLLSRKKSQKLMEIPLSNVIPEVKPLVGVVLLSAMKSPTKKLKKSLLLKSFPKPL